MSVLLSLVAQSRQGLLVAGGLPRGCAGAIQALAAHLGWPLLGDVTSGVRGTPGLQLLLQCAAGRRLLHPDCVLHFGTHVVARQYQELLAAAAPRLVQVAAAPDRLDPSHSAALRIVADPRRVAEQLHRRTRKRPLSVHAGAVQAAAARARQALAGLGAGRRAPSEPAVAAAVAAAAAGPPACGLFAASSMPIRDLDTFATPLPPGVTVAANRGASGIDGAVASAAGFAAGLQAPVIALLGDLSLLHDRAVSQSTSGGRSRSRHRRDQQPGRWDFLAPCRWPGSGSRDSKSCSNAISLRPTRWRFANWRRRSACTTHGREQLPNWSGTSPSLPLVLLMVPTPCSK